MSQPAPAAHIDDHGLIGDLRTAALVRVTGTLDWLCYPHFDSPSVFAALLDEEKGGAFALAPVGEGFVSRQRYHPDTAVLITSFYSGAGLVELTDFMPVPAEAHISDERPLGAGGPNPCLIRTVRAVRGPARIRLRCAPAFDYARAGHGLTVSGRQARFDGPGLSLHLHASHDLRPDGAAACAEFGLAEGEQATFVLSDDPRPPQSGPALDQTLRFWRGWLRQCRYTGRWRERVRRSAITLKLLTFAPTGAIVAAPTTSLPEWIGGERNWDYRYTWPRDAAFTAYALLRLGFTAEAKAFNGFILRHAVGPDGALQPLYRIGGSNHLAEHTLDHLAGYGGSRPVRIGNGAARQRQLDVYGAVLDALYIHNKHGEPLSYDAWTGVRRLLDYVCEHWRGPDDGIWEARSGPRQHVLSKVMCWVALDRGLRIAAQRGLPGASGRWLAERDAVYEDVMASGHAGDAQSFTQSYGQDLMDAANLLLPLVKFVGPRDPRWLHTLDRIQRDLGVGPLVYRYRLHQGALDGLSCDEGAFLACSYWLVECLARAGRLDQAHDQFEQLLALSSPLGLLSEELSPDGQALGNYPQALSHLALISAAFHLDRALDGAQLM